MNTRLPFAVAAMALVLGGCSSIQRDPPLQVWPDMRLQKKFKPQRSTSLFSDQRESRRPPEGAIARGHMLEENPFNTGMDGKLYVGKSPVKVTEALLTEGHWRFNAYCSPCHDETGLGKGMVPKRWPAWQPQNLMEDRIVEMADGDIFNVITYGRRTMPPYGYQNRPEDRWAIIAYVRALQLSRNASLQDIPEAAREAVLAGRRVPSGETLHVAPPPGEGGHEAPAAEAKPKSESEPKSPEARH